MTYYLNPSDWQILNILTCWRAGRNRHSLTEINVQADLRAPGKSQATVLHLFAHIPGAQQFPLASHTIFPGALSNTAQNSKPPGHRPRGQQQGG